MPKPRLRLRTMLVLVAAVALLFGVARWMAEWRRRADHLYRKADLYVGWVESLRDAAGNRLAHRGLCGLHIGEFVVTTKKPHDPNVLAMSTGAVERAFLDQAEAYERLVAGYRRAAWMPWEVPLPATPRPFSCQLGPSPRDVPYPSSLYRQLRDPIPWLPE